MRRLARIRISGDLRTIEEQWNSRYPHNPMIAGAVCVDLDAPEYAELKALYARFCSSHAMTWNETSQLVYEETDLAQFEILTLWVTGQAGSGGNSHGSVYDEVRRCPACQTETLGRQRAPIRLDPKEGDNSDLAVTNFGELVCSDWFRRVLTGTREEAVCQPVAWTPKRRASHGPRYQLVLNAHLGPFATSFPFVREGLCEVCGEYRNAGIDAPVFSERRQLRFPRSSYGGQSIALTQERFGAVHKFPLILISQKLYRLLNEQQVSGLWFEPAHLE
jgi:hypothetical protein